MTVMIGIVLWSDLTDHKAVFWCEDQGDLAYYNPSVSEQDAFGFFDAGDMVQFDVEMDSKMRRARNPQLIQEKVCEELPQSLMRKAEARGDGAGDKTAEIIPFVASKSAAAGHKTALKA